MTPNRLTWHKSSYSNANNANCVEVAEVGDAVLVRDTQHRGAGHLGFSPAEWAAFVVAARREAR